jgi:hypothetical protein
MPLRLVIFAIVSNHWSALVRRWEEVPKSAVVWDVGAMVAVRSHSSTFEIMNQREGALLVSAEADLLGAFRWAALQAGSEGWLDRQSAEGADEFVVRLSRGD